MIEAQDKTRQNVWQDTIVGADYVERTEFIDS